MKIAVQKTAGKTAKAFFKNGQLWIRIPYFLSKAEELRVLDKFQLWANNQVLKNPHLLFPPEERIFASGNIIKVRNQNFVLDFIPQERKSISWKFHQEKLELWYPHQFNFTLEDQKKTLAKAFSHHFLEEVKERVLRVNQKTLQVHVKEIKLKYTHSRWGSCSNKGNINLSSRLLLAPDEVLDYVILHELAHRKEMNHSDRFWDLIQKCDANYKDKEKWLKKNGRICDFTPHKSDLC